LTSSTLPAEQTGLSPISNPYASVTFNQTLFAVEFDSGIIYAISMTSGTYSVITFEDEQAYTFTSDSDQNCGVDLQLVQEGAEHVLYALFSSGDSFSGPWTNSTVVRLTFVTGGAVFGQLEEAGMVEVGINATRMVQVQYQPVGVGTALTTYLLVSAIGGTQKNGEGNDALSVITVVETGASMYKVADAVVGTYGIPDSEENVPFNLDFKSISVTPTFENDAYVHIMASTMDEYWISSFSVRETTASTIIEKAIAIYNGQSQPIPVTVEPFNLNDFDKIITPDPGVYGFFWTVGFSSAGSGRTGKLVVGRGDPTGDQLRFYDVSNANGADVPNAVIINSVALYGSNGCNLNAIAITAALPAPTVKYFRAAAPSAALTGNSSARELALHQRRKIAEERQRKDG
jgi:hypothetical protein